MSLTIGKLAARAGATVETIRYYERERLLSAPARNASGYRAYDHSALLRIQFIHRAQAIGFSLKEIRELIDLQTDPSADCSVVRQTADEKLRSVEQKIAALSKMKAELIRVIASCGQPVPIGQCAIIECMLHD